MVPITLRVLGMAALVLPVVLGVPVACAAAATGIAGIMVLRGPAVAEGPAGIIPRASPARSSLRVPPPVVALGFLAMHAGITTAACDAAREWVGRAPGGLATATIRAGAGFAVGGTLAALIPPSTLPVSCGSWSRPRSPSCCRQAPCRGSCRSSSI